MLRAFLIPVFFAVANPRCSNPDSLPPSVVVAASANLSATNAFPPGSWQHFLQHLPVKDGPVLDYRGAPVGDQSKAFAIVDYDIGQGDLQQCADALMRLRAEFLYGNGRQDEIGFHFTSGHFYSWKDYRAGKRPVVRGSTVQFSQGSACTGSYQDLRRYLNIVYSYAGTISLYKELTDAAEPEIGTVIITPGSPGHCSIIIDDSTGANGHQLFKLAEGYSPAQSIYVLRNPDKPGRNPWYELNAGTIATASYHFTHYKFGRFE